LFIFVQPITCKKNKNGKYGFSISRLLSSPAVLWFIFATKKGLAAMYIVLDTNILHQEGLNSRNMNLLERLAQEERISVCVPELVLREFLTRKVAEAREGLAKSAGLFPDIQKRLVRTPLALIAKEIEKLNEKFEQTIESSYSQALEEWRRQLKVETLKFDPAKLNSVFSDYFVGAGAFRSLKNRDDFPDSFIGYSILALKERGAPVTVVLKDGVLKRYLASNGVLIFDSLTELFSSVEVKKMIEDSDRETIHLEGLKSLLCSEKSKHFLDEFVRNDQHGLHHIYVELSEAESADALEMDAFGITINGIKSGDITTVTIGDVSYIRPGHFSVALHIDAGANVSFVASYMEYINLPAPRNELVDMSSMNGDGWADLGEFRKVELSGSLEIKFDPNWAAEDLEHHLMYLAADNAAVRVEMEINEAKIFK
jgi:hypothetical protein